jgi:hypothetical protein
MTDGATLKTNLRAISLVMLLAKASFAFSCILFNTVLGVVALLIAFIANFIYILAMLREI